MKNYDDIAPLPRVHIIMNNATASPPEGALYSNEIDHSQGSESIRLNKVEFARAPENFLYDHTLALSEDDTGMGDSVASGTFGHLVRAVNKSETPDGEQATELGHKVRFNLLKIGPKRPSPFEDRCEAWRKFQF